MSPSKGRTLTHQIIYSSDHIQLSLKFLSLAKRGRGDLAEVKLALWIMSPRRVGFSPPSFLRHDFVMQASSATTRTQNVFCN